MAEVLGKDLKVHICFFEVADCSSKIRLHNSQIDTKELFIKKLKRLRSELDQFIKFLEK